METPGDVACDHYHRYPEDIAPCSARHFAYGFPRPGRAFFLRQRTGQPSWLDFADRLIDAILRAGHPLALLLLGSAASLAGSGRLAESRHRRSIHRLRMIVHRRADRVERYATFNEPSVISVLGHATVTTPLAHRS
jgi:beta-glucosidase